MTSLRIGIGALVVLAFAGCGKSQQEAQPPAAAPTATTQSGAPAADATTVQAAFTAPNRFAADSSEDSWRKSAEVLTFFDVQPGMHVIDYLAGGGYYTELLSTLVGPQGQVVAYNNAEYAKYAGDKPTQRYANNRLPNVVQLSGQTDEIALEPTSLDAALFVQSYHDLYWRPKDGSWKPVDPAQSLAKLVSALKPGAVVLVIDHVATPGGDTSQTVDALHRIDPAVVKRDFEAAGLVFDSESPILGNPADDHTKVVFDPAVSHKTDQFVYKFRKPQA